MKSYSTVLHFYSSVCSGTSNKVASPSSFALKWSYFTLPTVDKGRVYVWSEHVTVVTRARGFYGRDYVYIPMKKNVIYTRFKIGLLLV